MRNKIERGIRPTGRGYQAIEQERDKDGKIIRQKLLAEETGKRAYLAATRIAGSTTVLA